MKPVRWYFKALSAGLLGLVFLSSALACSTPPPVPVPSPTAEVSLSPEPLSATFAARPTSAPQKQDSSAALQFTLTYRSLNPTVFVPDTIRAMGESNDLSFVFPLVDMLLHNFWSDNAAVVLEELLGPGLVSDSYQWAAWLWQQEDLEPPAGYDGWKGKFLRKISRSDYKPFLYNGVKTRVHLSEVVWGGVGIDELQALTSPGFLPALRATYMDDSERVFGVAVNGDYRAYPLRIMDLHEIANDVVGGISVTLTYSALSGSGILYTSDSADQPLHFGASGLLYRNNTLMYDRETKTLWTQLSGEPVVGRSADSGIRLKMLPMTLMTWREWRQKHPDTTVVDIETGFPAYYAREGAYAAYSISEDVMFPLAQRDSRLKAKEWVFAIRIQNMPKAYPLNTLRQEVVVNDTLSGQQVTLTLEPTSSAVRAYAGKGHTFQPSAQSAAVQSATFRQDSRNIPQAQNIAGAPDLTLVDEIADVWSVTEEALVNTSTGEQLARLPGHMAYWFAWYAFFPETEIYQP